MDRETARQKIRSSWRDILAYWTGPAKQRVNGEESYICPICRHGENGDGITYNPKSKDKNSLHCFGCNFTGDIIALYQQTEGLDFNTSLYMLGQQIGIEMATYTPNTDPQQAEEKTDYLEYYKACRSRILDPAAVQYLNARGISEETAAAYWLGYDPQADPAKAGKPCPRIIIPTSESHYIARSIDPDTPKQYAKMNPKGSSPGIFNKAALFAQEVREVFVVEGAFDALSLLEIGTAAIALNSTSNAETLLKTLENQRTEATLILALDNDPAGEKATQTLKEGLQRLNISYITADICGGHKDPNEALTADREAFIAAVEDAKKHPAARPDNTSFYIDNLMAEEIDRFKNDKKTGFDNLDKQAGGLYPGLYVLAATSSLGKTTFALQLADQLAAAGNEVIFFSLEQSRLEMVTKSIARTAAQTDKNTKTTSLAIRKKNITQEVLQAAKDYQAKVADRVSIVEGNFACNVSYIADYIRPYIKRNNVRPVVFVDYLQILQPEKERQTAKEAVDIAITELKRLSRELEITIIAISSVNRANYLTPIDFESLKESGSIEFTCDVVWGLQLSCIETDPVFSSPKATLTAKRAKVKEAKAENPRKIELVCLKNRYGISSYSCYFNYYPANDLFEEDADGEYYAQLLAQELAKQ